MRQKYKIDLGAYGKGIGTDEAIKMIKKTKKSQEAMVALGGSIVVYGEKSDGSDWKRRDPRIQTAKTEKSQEGSKSKQHKHFNIWRIMKKHLQIKRQANATSISQIPKQDTV